VQRGVAPFKTFMLKQTRETDLALFAKISKAPAMQGPDDVPLSLLVPAFVTSELKTGFQIGAEHSISKRTSFYMRAGYFKNNGNATVSWPGVSVTEAGAKQYMAALGMTHRF